MLAAALLTAGCGPFDGTPTTLSGAEQSACARPSVPAGTETPVVTPGFVQYAAVAGRAVWVALREGLIAKLDPFCGTATETVKVATELWPTLPNGSRPSFAALVSDGHDTLWAIAEVVDQAGDVTRSTVVRIDTVSAAMTARLALAPISYGRTSGALAASGDRVWLADAMTEGTAARLDPRTAVVIATVSTPEGGQSTNQQVGVAPDGAVWVPGGPHSVRVLNSDGGTRTDVVLPGTDISNASILPLGTTAWIGGSPAHRVSTTDYTVTAVGAARLDSLTPASRGVWGAVNSPEHAIVHVGEDAKVVATYPVANQTISLASTGDDVWRVDFGGVLYHVAG
ncbi:hypothetical protein MUY14_07330 [Amycolatopsis sp. FBCC-B4732]|uniref:hypothetical protein n=1 Tax=Amycolatopsis sp. FBCC-B4732 TaxID=3079339 RepID=UPI001FF52112|nr:hypothetical protein [Amycolatopsis sp. FBCC-B4732]UOX90427.1 hypothetical protein MUY14_07330 [Amycolatopsis sp. FBCC-B4732]